jgi:hypothetical protein
MQGLGPRTALVGVALGALAVCGCSLFQAGLDVFAFWPTTKMGSDQALPPIRPARDAMQIEITFVERSVGDPLLGNALWRDIDQLGAVSSNERDVLKRLGLRIGNVGATPGGALEKMLHLSDAIDTAPENAKLPVHRVYLRSSEGSSIDTNTVASCTIDVPLQSGTKETTYKNFKGVLRMTAHRLQDEWAQLEFVPEIHHGVDRLRPMPAKGGWQTKESPEVDALLTQRFSIKLHVGEMALMTTDGSGPRSFGHQCFVSDEPRKGPIQRVLVVRLANMSRIEPLYAPSRLSEQTLPGRK